MQRLIGTITLLTVIFLPMIVCGGVILSIADSDVKPSDYIPLQAGDCFVPPQGDPVYDQFYAQQVNPANCGALVDQSQSRVNNAQAEQVHVETEKIFTEMVMNSIGAFVTMLIVVAFIAIVIVGAIRQ